MAFFGLTLLIRMEFSIVLSLGEMIAFLLRSSLCDVVASTVRQVSCRSSIFPVLSVLTPSMAVASVNYSLAPSETAVSNMERLSSSSQLPSPPAQIDSISASFS